MVFCYGHFIYNGPIDYWKSSEPYAILKYLIVQHFAFHYIAIIGNTFHIYQLLTNYLQGTACTKYEVYQSSPLHHHQCHHIGTLLGDAYELAFFAILAKSKHLSTKN